MPRAGDEGTRFGFNENIGAADGAAEQMAAIGADTARRRLSWVEIEPAAGSYDWSHYDAIYEKLLDQGMRPLWVLVDAPCWARGIPGCSPSAPAGAPGIGHAADVGELLAAVAERYPESLGIEVGNEVNDERFWRDGLNPNDYAAILGTAADAIHAADPDMPVIAAGLAPFERPGDGRLPWQVYLRAMVNAGAAEKVDAFAFHPYPPAGTAAGTASAVLAELDAFIAELARLGVEDVPVWVTEVGVSTVGPYARTPDQQAADLVAILTALQDRGTEVAILHRLRDGAAEGFPLEAGFGVIAADGRTPKPAYCALGTVRGSSC